MKLYDTITNPEDVTNKEYVDSCVLGMKHIQTINLTEAAVSMKTTFAKPLKEIYMVFVGTLDGLSANVSNCSLAARTDAGQQFFFYTGNNTFTTTTNRGYVVHAKEIVERRWESVHPQGTLIMPAGDFMQGADDTTRTPRISYSTRFQKGLARYVSTLEFLIPNASSSGYAFAAGSTLKIYGVEVDE